MLSIEQKKLLYRAAHRGTKEMDWLVGRFVASQITSLNAHQREELALLLNLADADIHDLLYDFKDISRFPALCKIMTMAEDRVHILHLMRDYHQIKPGS